MLQELPAEVAREPALASRADALAALYRLTDRLYRGGSLADVYEAALDAIVDALGCRRASILLFDTAGVMRFAAWRGLSAAYREAVEGHSPWQAGQPDPQPIFVEDIEATDEPEWLKQTVRGEGIRALAFIPLVAQGTTIGKFMTYYEAPHDFARQEVDVAVAIARQVGFSLERDRAEQARRHAEEELRESEARFRLMSEQAPVMIWTSDAEGRCLHLNSMLRAFWDVEESELAGFDWQTMLHPEDAPEVGRRMGAALAGRSSVTLNARVRNAAGEYRILQTNARPHFSAKGEFRGMIGVNVDVTERELAAKALRESEERFRLAVEAAPSGMVMTDGAGRIVLANAQAERLFGYGRDELIGRTVEILIPDRFKRTHPAFREAYAAKPSARPMGAGRDLFALTKGGEEVPVEIGLSPILTGDGLMVLAAVVDISERRRADLQRELLVAELNHRVKNTLAVVQAIAYQTFRAGAASPEARAAFDGRLIALSTAHNLLTQANWESASLEQLAADALQARGANAERVSLAGPHVLLQPKPALAIAMALHELCTNAVKYGALSNGDGRVELDWHWTEEQRRRLKLTWRECGGPPVSPPTRRGFGTRLVERTLAQDLNGEVTMEFKPEGVVCCIEVPLPRK